MGFFPLVFYNLHIFKFNLLAYSHYIYFQLFLYILIFSNLWLYWEVQYIWRLPTAIPSQLSVDISFIGRYLKFLLGLTYRRGISISIIIIPCYSVAREYCCAYFVNRTLCYGVGFSYAIYNSKFFGWHTTVYTRWSFDIFFPSFDFIDLVSSRLLHRFLSYNNYSPYV